MLTTDSETLPMITNEMDKCSIKISEVPTALSEKYVTLGEFFFVFELKIVE